MKKFFSNFIVYFGFILSISIPFFAFYFVNANNVIIEPFTTVTQTSLYAFANLGLFEFILYHIFNFVYRFMERNKCNDTN